MEAKKNLVHLIQAKLLTYLFTFLYFRGGTYITVSGKNLAYVVKPQLVITREYTPPSSAKKTQAFPKVIFFLNNYLEINIPIHDY